jgi:integrase
MASIQRLPNGKRRARYRDASGREHARHFDRKVDAQRWLDEVTASIVTGQYVDPNAGRITFRQYAELWRAAQVHRPNSQAHVETMLRRHAYPTFGDRPLASIVPSDVQLWVRRLTDGGVDRRPLAPATVTVLHSVVSAIMKAAVRDRRIPSNPCEGTRLPRKERRRVVPPTTEQVMLLAGAVPPELGGLVLFVAGTGVRQGEAMGLTLDRVDLFRREVRIDRQLIRVVNGEPVFGPPKTDASYRTIPLPDVVVEALERHVEELDVRMGDLVFTLDGGPISRQAFGHKWRPVAREVGLTTGTGIHSLRHYYASLLIRHGESVKTVQARLGHASAAETLDTYSHLWPDSDDRTREAVDRVLKNPADCLRTV